MIGKLKGLVDEIEDGSIILDVQGVGYLIFISRKTQQALPARGEAVSLYIETQMREDALRLFGFLSRAEQQWFQLLQNVQGVGAKLALAILGSLSPAELSRAISLKDITALTRAPGAGKKLAERLINELKNKLPAADAPFAPARAAGSAAVGTAATGTDSAADALSALNNLGYKAEEAARVVSQAAQTCGGEAETAALIKLSLQILAKNK